MYDIERLPNVITIGRVGEDNFRTEQFDMTSWMEEMPNGVPSIVAIRPGETDADAYIASTTFSNNILTWVVTESDTSAVGTGTIQIWLEQEADGVVERRGKSAMVAVRIYETIGTTDSIPAAQVPWLEQMTALRTETVNAKTAAENAQAGAEAAESATDGKAEEAEAWAVGQRGGVDVGESDPTYHNNSKYYSQQSGSGALASQGYAEAAEAAKNAAESARDKQPIIDSRTGIWMVWSASAGAYVSTGTAAQGPQGDPGANGTNGTDGRDGTDGEDGTSAYVYIRYASNSPTQDSDMQTSPGPWIGICSTDSDTAPTTYTSYTWYKIKGENGNDGANAYTFIKYSAEQPTQDSDMKDTADAWMGIYSGTSSTAPTAYTNYTWYKIKGEDGSVANAYGTTIAMAADDATKIATAIGTKAGKPLNPTSGNLAALDGYGDLTDSGHSWNEVTGDQIPITEDAASTVQDYVDDYMLDIASVYDEDETYDVGEYVWHDNLLYRCKTAITTAESWTSAHWSRASVTREIGKLNDLQNGLAIVVEGNKTSYASGAAIGDYVLVRNSTITGVPDGAYTAAKAIPYNTEVDITYFTACSKGIANSLSEQIANLNGQISSKANTARTNWGTSLSINCPSNIAVLFSNYDAQVNIWLPGASGISISSKYVDSNGIHGFNKTSSSNTITFSFSSSTGNDVTLTRNGTNISVSVNYSTSLLLVS